MSATPLPPPVSSTGEAVRAVVGLVAVLALAWIAGHPAVRRVEKRLRLSEVVTAGFPFVVLGLVARLPSVNVVSDQVLREIRPLLAIGLGWIGFTMGFRFDARGLDALPRGTASVVMATALLPFATIVGACGLVLLAQGGLTTEFLRDAILLGAAGAMTARSAKQHVKGQDGAPEVVTRVRRIVQLEETAAVFVLLLLAAFFRPDAPASGQVGWQLPGIGWAFVTLGMGTAMGGIVYALLTSFRASGEILLVMLGSVCFTAGMASFLRLSPIVVCFLAGTLVANFPGSWKDQVRAALIRVERPIYLVFLFLAGALWHFGAWQGWLLMIVFVAARLVGKWLGVALVRRRDQIVLSAAEQRTLAVAPMGALAVAIAVNAQDLYAGSRTIPWIVTTVIGGAIVTEIVVQAWAARGRRAATATPAPVLPSRGEG